jgi:hypothetical protein
VLQDILQLQTQIWKPKGEHRGREKGKMLHIARMSVIISNLLKEIRKLILTCQLQVQIAESAHYEPFLLNCDVSRAENPLCLVQKTPDNISILCSSKHFDLPDVEFKNDPLLWPQQISDNLCQQVIEVEPFSSESMLKLWKQCQRFEK